MYTFTKHFSFDLQISFSKHRGKAASLEEICGVPLRKTLPAYRSWLCSILSNLVKFASAQSLVSGSCEQLSMADKLSSPLEAIRYKHLRLWISTSDSYFIAAMGFG